MSRIAPHRYHAWVKIAIWGSVSQAVVWVYLVISLIVAIASVAFAIVSGHAIFFAGGLMVFSTLWYFLAICWVNQHGSWN